MGYKSSSSISVERILHRVKDQVSMFFDTYIGEDNTESLEYHLRDKLSCLLREIDSELGTYRKSYRISDWVQGSKRIDLLTEDLLQIVHFLEKDLLLGFVSHIFVDGVFIGNSFFSEDGKELIFQPYRKSFFSEDGKELSFQPYRKTDFIELTYSVLRDQKNF